MKYEAIIFDVGDTLLEHCPSQKQIYVDRLEGLGFTIDSEMGEKIALAITAAAQEQIIKEENGTPRMSDEDFVLLLDTAALRCINFKEDDRDYIQKLKQRPVPEQRLEIIPGAIEALQALKNRGYRLGVVSNHRKWMPDYLREIGLSHFFEAIVVSEAVGVEKPDPRIMQIALDALSLSADVCLYVGDHPFDVLCAKRAGMDCAWLAARDEVLPISVPYKEDYRIQSLHKILNIV